MHGEILERRALRVLCNTKTINNFVISLGTFTQHEVAAVQRWEGIQEYHYPHPSSSFSHLYLTSFSQTTLFRQSQPRFLDHYLPILSPQFIRPIAVKVRNFFPCFLYTYVNLFCKSAIRRCHVCLSASVVCWVPPENERKKVDRHNLYYGMATYIKFHVDLSESKEVIDPKVS